MECLRRGRSFILFFFLPGFLSTFLWAPSSAFADTILLKNEKEIKGLVVEKHTDRIILSTEKGEIPILLSGIKNIQYDDAEQNFMQIGRAYEAKNKYGEALAYYEKAVEINPAYEEAKKASAAMKSRFWAATTEGPQSEMDKQQAIYDSWGQGRSPELAVKKRISKDVNSLRESLGLTLIKKSDWVYAGQVTSKGDAASAGLRRGDRLVSIDAESLRYLAAAVVAKKMIQPRYSSFILEYERECRIQKAGEGKFSGNLGLDLKLDSLGISVLKIVPGGPADQAGIREGDLVEWVNRESTRFMPLGKVLKIIKDADQGAVVLSVRRSAMLTRR